MNSKKIKIKSAEWKKKLEPRFERWLELVDFGTKYLTRKDFKTGNEPLDVARTPIVIGLWAVIIVFGFFGLWAALAPLDSAAVARGTCCYFSQAKKQFSILKVALFQKF